MPHDFTNRRSRREVLLAGLGIAFGAAGLASGARPAAADLAAVQKAMAALLGDRQPQEGRVKIDAPEIAENGNTVPVTVEVDSPMTEQDHVKAVHIFADGNPRPEVASSHCPPARAAAGASTRIRLAKTQNLYAVAEMSDGSLYMAKREVKVTIGGCGG
jgi:sulfur-oxidizing protein SoxY